MDKLHNIKDLYEFLQFDKGIQDGWHHGIRRGERDKWINFDLSVEGQTDSLLLYRKGNHEAFTNLFSRHYADNHNVSYEPRGNLNWYIPYKDPIDKLLGGFLSSENFGRKHHHKFVGMQGNFYNELEPLLLQFLNEVLGKSIIKSHMYDNHITPLSVTLENALIDKPQFLLNRLVGINLDVRDELYRCVYKPIIQRHGMTEEIFRISMHRRSPYGGNKKHYLDMFKYYHANVMKELVQGPLYNEYKLLDFFIHHQHYKQEFYNG